MGPPNQLRGEGMSSENSSSQELKPTRYECGVDLRFNIELMAMDDRHAQAEFIKLFWQKVQLDPESILEMILSQTIHLEDVLLTEVGA